MEEPGWEDIRYGTRYCSFPSSPTAEFRHPSCDAQMERGVCKNRQCLFPKPCRNLRADHRDYIELLRKLRELPNVRYGTRYCSFPSSLLIFLYFFTNAWYTLFFGFPILFKTASDTCRGGSKRYEACICAEKSPWKGYAESPDPVPQSEKLRSGPGGAEKRLSRHFPILS